MDLVGLLQPVSNSELVKALQVITGKEKIEINVEKNLAKALELIQLFEGYYFVGRKWQGRFFSTYFIDLKKLRSRVVVHYSKFDRKRMELIGRFGVKLWAR